MQLLLLGVVFFGTVLLIVAIYGVVNRRSLEASDAAREQLRVGTVGVVGDVSILRDDRSSEIPFLNQLLAGRALSTWIAAQLQRAGSEQKIGQIAGQSAAVAGRIAPPTRPGPERGVTSVADRTVDGLPDQVGVPGMAGVLLEHVH